LCAQQLADSKIRLRANAFKGITGLLESLVKAGQTD
jgi:hypothetical protein